MTVFHMKKFRGAAKKSNRQIIREAKAMTTIGQRAWALLIGVLAQVGGEITLSRGTQETTSGLISRGLLNYEMVEGPGDGEYTIRLLNGEQDAAVAPIEPAGRYDFDTAPQESGYDV